MLLLILTEEQGPQPSRLAIRLLKTKLPLSILSKEQVGKEDIIATAGRFPTSCIHASFFSS
jgi:hypothetical protein